MEKMDGEDAQNILEEKKPDIGVRSWYRRPLRLCQLNHNTLFMVYKGFWILKTRGIPYYFLILYSFYPLFHPLILKKCL